VTARSASAEVPASRTSCRQPVHRAWIVCLKSGEFFPVQLVSGTPALRRFTPRRLDGMAHSADECARLFDEHDRERLAVETRYIP